MLPGKALELLDAAGEAVKLRASSEPGEIADVRKKFAFIFERIESATMNSKRPSTTPKNSGMRTRIFGS